MLKKPDKTILVIADQAVARNTIRGHLDYYGYTVLEAADGVEGLQVYHRERLGIGLVLLDLTSSKVPNKKMLVALRQLDPKVRVAVCTEQATSELRYQDEYSEAVGILRKPVSTDRLLAVVRKGLQSQDRGQR